MSRQQSISQLAKLLEQYWAGRAVGGSAAGAAGAGVTDHHQLTGLNRDDHPQYLNNIRGDARYSLKSDPSVQEHDVIGTFHFVDGSQYDIVGLTATDTLGLLTPGSDISGGNKILISDGSGNAAVGALTASSVATPAITSAADLTLTAADDILLVSANSTSALRVATDADVRVVRSLKVGADTDPAYTLDVAGNGRFTGHVYAQNDLYVTGEVMAADATFTNMITVPGIEPANSGDTLTLQSNNLRINNFAGTNYWKIDSDGNLKSASPNYLSYTSGAMLTPAGFFEAQDSRIRGSIQTAVFEYRQLSAIGGSVMLTKSSAKLHEDFEIDVRGVDPSFNITYDLKISDSAAGHAQVFDVGDILVIRAVAAATVDLGNADTIIPLHKFWQPQSITAASPMPVEYWFEVASITDNGDYYTYTCDWAANDTDIYIDYATLKAGTAVVNIGQVGENGGITLIADGAEPFIDFWMHREPPGTGVYPPVRLGNRYKSTVRVGHIGGTALGLPGEVGIMGSEDLTTDTDDSTFFVLSNQRQLLSNVPLSITSDGDTMFAVNEYGPNLRLRTITWADQAIFGEPSLPGSGRYDWRLTMAPEFSSEITFAEDPDNISVSSTWGRVSSYKLEEREIDWFDEEFNTEYQFTGYASMVDVEAIAPLNQDAIGAHASLIGKFEQADGSYNAAYVRVEAGESGPGRSIYIMAGDSDTSGTVYMSPKLRMKGLKDSRYRLTQPVNIRLEDLTRSAGTTDQLGDPLELWQVYATTDGTLKIKLPG